MKTGYLFFDVQEIINSSINYLQIASNTSDIK